MLLPAITAPRDTSVSKLSYLTHALQDFTVPKELDMIHNPVLWALLVTEQVWPMRVSVHNVLVDFTVRRLVVTLSLANVREVGQIIMSNIVGKVTCPNQPKPQLIEGNG